MGANPAIHRRPSGYIDIALATDERDLLGGGPTALLGALAEQGDPAGWR